MQFLIKIRINFVHLHLETKQHNHGQTPTTIL